MKRSSAYPRVKLTSDVRWSDPEPPVVARRARSSTVAVQLAGERNLTYAFLPSFWDANMKKSGAGQGQSASELISKRIVELGDWRGETLGRMRKLIKEADPDVAEEWKWMGTPVWSHDGIICTGESYKKVVKLTFAKGASLKDPTRLFNSSLEGNVRRAIDIAEGAEVDESAFKALVREAVALNRSGKSKPSRKSKPKS
jgi:hypothetical protein